jgi:hypothetical protein
MNTQQLVESLSKDVPRIARHALIGRLAMGIMLGGCVTAVLVAVVLGIRPDLKIAIHGFSFWMKWSYTISLGLGTALALVRLARPASPLTHGLWVLGIPVLLLIGIGIGELASTPPASWGSVWLGQSWMVCPWLVLILAMPIFCGLLWSFRKLAPTRFRVAGAAAGFAAGSWAATIYCLHCPEGSALFVLTWYSLGIVFSAGMGALLAPRLMRW